MLRQVGNTIRARCNGQTAPSGRMASSLVRLFRHTTRRRACTGWPELGCVMDIRRLQDRTSRGMGIAARKYGAPFALYRPKGANQPLGAHNKVRDIAVALRPAGRWTGNGRATAIWDATLDSSYTVEGDYLAGSEGTFFIATQRAASPVICVLTNCRVTMIRPSFATQGGYSGLYSTGGAAVIRDWPAHSTRIPSLEAINRQATPIATETLLLPKLPVSVCVGDVVMDGSDGSAVVMNAEQTALGWRVTARAATS